jgi:hypothetical protein
VEAQGSAPRFRTPGRQGGAEDRQLGAHQGQSQLDGSLAPLVFVGGAYLGTLPIAEQRQIPSSWDVALGEFRRGAHIHYRATALQKGIDRQPLCHGKGVSTAGLA